MLHFLYRVYIHNLECYDAEVNVCRVRGYECWLASNFVLMSGLLVLVCVLVLVFLVFDFFFQAEDGIRDADVTGVQTCALPILLIFTGFCLISALVSRFLIDNLSDRILNEAQVAKARAEEVQHSLRLVQNELLPLIDTETEQEAVENDQTVIDAGEELDVTSTKVLKVLSSGRFIFRSLGGICREANEEESAVLKTLHVLVTRSLAGKVSGQNGVRWHITEKGRRVLENQL